jgi:hypothetical protein
LWGRRSVAIGAVLVALALVGGLVLLIAGGDGDEDDSAAATTSSQAAQLQDKFLKQTVVEVDKGISVRRPGNWSHTKRNGVITLQSRDSCLAMTLSAPQPADQAKKLRSDSIDLFRSSYRGAQVQSAPSSQVGGIPTSSNTINFKDQKGNPIRVLLSVGTGNKYAYLTEIVVRDPRCQGDLQLGNLVLSSVQYTK